MSDIRLRPILIVTVIAAGMLASTLPGRAASTAGTSLAYVPQGSWLVQQFTHFSDRYYARVAGRDGGLPPHVNGHDEFIAEWTRDVVAALRGLPVRVLRSPFPTPGFKHLKATHPGENVVIVVPGSLHPDQAVLVGAHPDGEPTSKGSAYDDASGCIITLGVARELGTIWRAHGPPSVTVEFALFDAEEQGLIGSTEMGFAYRHGALQPRIRFMIDEEQSGVGYPVRPFGLLNEKLLPMSAITTGGGLPRFSPLFGRALPARKSELQLALARLRTARREAFPLLATTYGQMTYRGGTAPAFATADESRVLIGPSTICCSDNAPFEALGLPTATFAGNASFYDTDGTTWAYPFDQPQDTMTSLACDTGGSPQPGEALRAALDLPAAMSVSLVQAYAPPAPGNAGAALFSDLPGAGTALDLQAVGVDRVVWSFGDGKEGSGQTVHHVYRRPGTYRLRLTSAAGGVTRIQTFSLTVPAHRPLFHSPLDLAPPPLVHWHPPQLDSVAGCH